MDAQLISQVMEATGETLIMVLFSKRSQEESFLLLFSIMYFPE